MGITWAIWATWSSFWWTSLDFVNYDGAGVLVYTTQANLGYTPGQNVIISDAFDPTKYNIWYVLDYTATTLTVQATRTTWVWSNSNRNINLQWFDGTAWSIWVDGATGAIWATGFLQAGTFTGTIPYWNGSAWITSSSAVYYTASWLFISGSTILSTLTGGICLGTTSTGLVISSTSGSVYGLISWFVSSTYVSNANSWTYFNANSGSYFNTYISGYISGYSVVNSFVRPGLSTVIPTTQAVVDYIDLASQSLGSIITTWAYVLSGNGTAPIGMTWQRIIMISGGNLSFQVFTGNARVEKGSFSPN